MANHEVILSLSLNPNSYIKVSLWNSRSHHTTDIYEIRPLQNRLYFDMLHNDTFPLSNVCIDLKSVKQTKHLRVIMSTNDQNLTQPSSQTFCSDFLLFNEENTISSYIYISFERWRQITHFQVETRLGCSKKSKFWIFLVCSTFWAQTILTPTDLTWKCLSPAWGNDKGEVCSIVMRRKM